VPQPPQVKAVSLTNSCYFSDPSRFSGKDHSRLVRTTSSTPVLSAVILKKVFSAALFKVSQKKDQFEFLSETAAEAGNLTFSLL